MNGKLRKSKAIDVLVNFIFLLPILHIVFCPFFALNCLAKITLAKKPLGS